MKKVIVIVGQTATGKSALAVKISKLINGEVVSADSRQVYKGLDLGSGKITKEEMKRIPHHLIDVASIKKQFSVAEYKKLAEQKIKDISSRGKVPIICGGTGFYIDALTKGVVLPEVPPNPKLRNALEKKSEVELFQMLQKIDPRRAKNIDRKNKIRLIRAIEINQYLGKVPPIKNKPLEYEFIKVGLQVPDKSLRRKIKLRLRNRLRAGMAIEIFGLRQQGVPWKRFLELGFDQKFTTLYLQKKISEHEMLERLFQGNWQYAKRQMTWFKRDKEIRWFDPKNYKEIKKYVLGKI